MKENERYFAALAYATAKHNGQTRKEGVPYITHPIAVAEILEQKGYGEDYIIAGLFHDLLEDTDATESEILELSNESVLCAVKLLTKQSGYNMREYIDGIKRNPIAFAVKAADRLHNLQCAPAASVEFRKKYIAESREWYLDFCPEIEQAVIALEKTI
ncbi:MAG: bifunctional (p)ppGpp synthetase/guanosine-3',5'-bis(diphosphate) 3'-pyrophosphohydrolase [Clostridia bacterium]|nr:bifunctional (p)ppGpp synthetase/guanosine-3',5'-bis(diphosphate) 3'-pyrophosphohydrolase [Clostridia bacterium]